MMSPREDSETLEIRLLAEAIWQKYGYDFRDYAEASFKRRVLRAVAKYRCSGVAELLHKLLSDPGFFSLLLTDLTVVVTELFRDPHVFKILREKVMPYLRTYPEIKIWCAGCATGEEPYSLAIILKEEGLLERSLIYGTDINQTALRRAKDGIVDAEYLKDATRRYFEAGGKASLHDYYTAKYGIVIFDAGLRDRMVFSDHNLASDGTFGEMHLVLCRNALIYFKRELHDRAINLFADSLCTGGFLCLGTKESLRANAMEIFEDFARPERIYRKRRGL